MQIPAEATLLRIFVRESVKHEHQRLLRLGGGLLTLEKMNVIPYCGQERSD